MNRIIKKRAFTLIELLVVISIIALLLSILMPALNKVKKQAKKVVCMSNVKQNTLGLFVYAGSNNDRVPLQTAGNWIWDVTYFCTDVIIQNGGSRETFYCPARQQVRSEDETYWRFSDAVRNRLDMPEPTDPEIRKSYWRVVSYFFMMDIDSDEGRVPKPDGKNKTWVRKLSSVRQPGALELVTDATLYFPLTDEWDYRDATYDTSSNHLKRPGGEPEGGNSGFCDGHVEWVDFDDMKPRYGHIGFDSSVPHFYW